MTDLQISPLPRQSWRILGLAAVLLLATTVTAIGLISAGFFDPKPAGELTAELPLQPQSVPAGMQRLDWLDYSLTADDFSLRLTAAHESGELDVGYGLALGGDDAALVVAVSPLGYAAVVPFEPLFSQTESDLEELDSMIANRLPVDTGEWAGASLFEWQLWPHVNTDQETNEIWLDKNGETMTVRINRELLWNGSVSLSVSQVGLWSGSFDKSGTIDFETLAIFSE